MENPEITRRRFMGLSAAGVLGFALAPHLVFAKNTPGVTRVLTQLPVSAETEQLTEVGFLVLESQLQYLDYYHEECGSFERMLQLPESLSHICSKCGKTATFLPGAYDDISRNNNQSSHYNYAGFLITDAEDALINPVKSEIAMEIGPSFEGTDQISITRSELCHAIIEREPAEPLSLQDLITEAPITYFVEASAGNLTTTINHVWRLNGKVVDKISLKVSGGRWRTWTQKGALDPGYWSVTSETFKGDVLDVKHFAVQS
ncbi:DUF2914 domain-containing protein [bacterium]|nr:DUF2914 domain-containing protein [bacterium]MBU1882289.1 DUF2914 domain-containing protein [bacterium]